MFAALKNHPFAVEAFFENSLVLTFAIPQAQLLHAIPECLTLDTFHDDWAFLAVALVQTSNLRPKGFPEFMGNDFFLIGYRIFVRYTTKAGKNLRGLYIIKSETDKRTMQFLGNLFTHYKYRTIDITQSRNGEKANIESVKSGLKLEVNFGGEVQLPATSPFENWKEARRFAGPLPFTFSYDQTQKQVLIVEGVRQNWNPEPVQVVHHQVSFLNQPQFEGAVLANAFLIQQVPYYWKKGRIELWKP